MTRILEKITEVIHIFEKLDTDDKIILDMSKVKYNMFFITATIMAAFLFFINNVFAEVDKIIFYEEDPQTILFGQSSEKYQIQLQDSSGLVATSTETIYLILPLEFGDFSTNKDGEPYTNSSSIYIAKGNSNKYFYFKPKSIGDFELKIIAKNKDETKQWETSQIVFVRDSDTSTTTDDSDITDEVSTSTATTTDISSSTIKTVVKTRYVYISTHTSSEDLSDYTSGNTFEISAGRDRISYVGTPVDFNAKHNKKDNRVDFTWSFGDGTSEKGQEISHIYKNPGDYIVILNSKNGVNDAVSRANIIRFSNQI